MERIFCPFVLGANNRVQGIRETRPGIDYYDISHLAGLSPSKVPPKLIQTCLTC